MNKLTPLLPFANPFLLALASFSYLLGESMARYLGRADSPLSFGLGAGWALLLLLAMNLLAVYFRPHNEPLIENETLTERNWLRAAAFQLSVASLGVVAVLTGFLIREGVSAATLFFLVFILFAALAYALPPLRLVASGFGELILSLLIAALIPAFAFTLQTGEVHRLLGAVAFPLTALTLAFFLALNFPNFAEDSQYERGSLLVRIGWQRAVPLHHILTLSGYLLFALMPLLGIPWAVIWPVFLVMPFALLQIFWMQQIALGANPNWKFLKILVYSVIGLSVYTLTITFWMR